MSTDVQRIIDAVRALTPEQFGELLSAPEFGGSAPAGMTRPTLVRSIRGKYAHVPTSSDAFAARKQDEIELEESSRTS
jgi:hypothetical protein